MVPYTGVIITGTGNGKAEGKAREEAPVPQPGKSIREPSLDWLIGKPREDDEII